MSKRHDDWRDAAALIDQQIDGDRDALMRALTDRFGLTVAWFGDHTRVRGLGITAKATSGTRMALVNWSNAARRRLIREAV